MTQTSANITSTSSADTVGVFDVNFNQLFAGAKILKAGIRDESTFFSHPLEDGTSIIDHTIFNPIEIGLDVIVTGQDYRVIYQDIKQVYQDRTPVVVQTRADIFEDMYIMSIPHEEDPSYYDSFVVSIQLKKTNLATTIVSFSPANDADFNTIERGQQDTSNASTQQNNRGSSLLARVFGGSE